MSDQEPRHPSLSSTAHEALRRVGGVTGLAISATPPLVFVLFNALFSLTAGLIATLVVSALLMAWRIRRGEQLRHAVGGLLFAGACAAIAAITGEARGFFLLSVLIALAAGVISIGSVLIGKPLAALLYNRLVGGGPNWREHPRLPRIYSWGTLIGGTASTLDGLLQGMLYSGNQTGWLGVTHVVFPLLSLSVQIMIILMARRAILHTPTPARR